MVSSYIAHIDALHASHIFPLITAPVHSCPISTPFYVKHTALVAISVLETNRTHCHLCPTRYSFTTDSSEACEGKVTCPRTQHRNNVRILKGERHDANCRYIINSEKTFFIKLTLKILYLNVLTLKVLRYLCINHGDLNVFSIWNHHKCLS